MTRAISIRHRPELEPELLEKLRDRLVGIASQTAGPDELPDGAMA